MIAVLVGFGKDLAVYRNCRKVWDLYYETLNHGDVRIHFCQTVEHQNQEVFSAGNDLFVLKRTEGGIKHVSTLNREDSSPRWGDWTIDSNTEVIARQKLSTRWLLSHYREDCSHIFYTNVTTLPCTKSLKAICSALPSRNLYAGSLCRFREPFRGIDGFTFASGAGTLLSNDVAQKICEEDRLDYLGYPNDVWIGSKLSHLKRLDLPRYDFERLPHEIDFGSQLAREVNSALDAGHFHFRAKSKSGRERVDHLILLEVYKALSLRAAKE
jgi:hypothetical protein